MSHEIDGERAIYSKTPAWHRIGTVKEDGWMSADECLAVLNPNNDVIQKVPAYAKVIKADGVVEYVESEDTVAVLEKHPDVEGKYRILSFMAKEYGLVQIVDQFRFLDEVVGNIGGSHYASAARLRNGKQTIVTIDTGQISLDPNGVDDRVDKFIFGSNSYDGSWAFRVKMVGFRVDCANMAAMALRHQTTADWSTKHTKNIMDRANAAKATLGLWTTYFEEFAVESEHMIHVPIHDDAYQRIVESLFTSEDGITEKDREAIGQVRTIYELSPSCQKIHGTVWGALNSVTEWSDWYSKVRGGKKSSMEEARLRRQMGETDGGLKQRAWDMFLDYADEHKPLIVPVP